MPRHAQAPRRRVRRTTPARPRRRQVRWGRLLLVGFSLASLFALAACADVVYRAVAAVPAMADPMAQLGASSELFDGNGQLVELMPSLDDRQPVSIDQVPPLLQRAFVATEDRSFYTNIGVSFRGIARAAVDDLLHPAYLQGASTISQQLARTLYLNQNDTISRKLKEAVLAIELNRRYTKAEILEMYLNDISLGPNLRGIEAASQAYFNQSDLTKLTLAQMALLAGLPQAPSAYDPLINPSDALTRRNEVLGFMQEQHYITAAQYRQAVAAPLGVVQGQSGTATSSYADPWIVDAVIEDLQQPPYNLTLDEIENGGLQIYTTFSPEVESAAVAALQAHMNAVDPNPSSQSDELEAALAMIDQHTGNIIALVGGREHTTALAFDRATDNKRQPGSSIKPVAVYIPALENGLTAGTVVDDVIHSFPSGPNQPQYLPEDDQEPYDGLTTLTEAVRRSVNTVALQVLNHIGVQKGFDNAVAMGLPLTKDDNYLPLAIGGISEETCCSPLQMASAYAVIANGGMKVTPRLITKVVGPDGSTIGTDPVTFKQVVDPRIAYVMTRILEAVTNPQPAGGWDENWGTGYDGTVHDNVPGWPTAGKTGTTDNNQDAWFVGYTPLYTAAVWIGYDQKTSKANLGLYGGTYAGPIFKDTMEAAVAGQTVQDFPEPQGVVQALIDAKCAPWNVCSPSALTPAAWIRKEWFVAGTQPTPATSDNLWEQVQVTNTSPPLLWSAACGGQPVTRVYLNRQILGESWAEPIAFAKGTGSWAQYLPADLNLAPPQKTCTPLASVGGSPGGTGNQACAPTWSVVLQLGQPSDPALICLPLGQAATLTFISGDGQPHELTLQGQNEAGVVPANGSPLIVSFTPSTAGTTLILMDNTPVGRLEVQAMAPPPVTQGTPPLGQEVPGQTLTGQVLPQQ